MIFPWQRATQFKPEPILKMLQDKWCERCRDHKPETGFKGWCYDCRREMIVSYLMFRALRYFTKFHMVPDISERAKKAIAHYGK